MKRYLSLIIASILPWTDIAAQNKQELLDEIDKDLQNIQEVLNLSNLHIELSTTNTEFDPDNPSNFEKKSLTTQADKVQLTKFFNNLHLASSLFHPYNVISIDKDEYDLLELLGYKSSYFMNNAEQEPVYTPTLVQFLDGTVLKENLPIITKDSIAARHRKQELENGETYEYVSEEQMTELEKMIWNSSSFNETIALASPKPIKNIAYRITLPLSAKKIYKPAIGQKAISTPYGIVTLDTIAGTKVHCTLPHTEREGTIAVEAYYKNNKVLAQKSYSSNTMVSDSKRDMYLQWVATLSMAREQVDKGFIKTKGELKNYLDAHPVITKDKDDKRYKSAIYTFAGPVSQVAFIVSDSLEEKATFNITYDLYYRENDQETFLSMDAEKKLIGLVDRQGKWIVQPQFNEHFRPLNRYFYWDQYNDNENTYWYNPASKTIQKVDYKIEDPEIYDGKYVKIESRTNGPQGLVNAVTGKIVLPIEYDYISFQSKKFWHLEKGDKEGILDQKFKVILPLMYDDVDAEGDYVFVKKDGWKKDAYDATGSNITKGRYDDLKGTYNNGLLLVGKRHISKEGYISTKYFYIDTSCNVRIDVNAKGYQDPEEFSAGMAAVKNENGDYGYINTKGELAIPFQYKYAGYFYLTSELALVTLKDETDALINKKGKIIKKFEGEIIKRKSEEKDRASDC